MDSPQNAAQLLRKVKALAGLDETTLTQLAAELEWRSFKAREIIVRHLERASDVYFVIEGACSARLETPRGRLVPIRKLEAGDHFGELAALAGAPRSVSVDALTDGVLARCPEATFQRLVETNAVFANAIAARLARTVISLTDRLYEFAALEVRFRLYSELLRLARAGRQDPDGVVIEDAPTHEALAAAIGAQREHVTRELGLLASEGVIRQARPSLIICDIVKLRDLVQRRGGVTASLWLDWGASTDTELPSAE